MQKLAQFDKVKLLDVLTERLTFERAGVKLYDTVIDRLQRSSDSNLMRMLPTMRTHRDEEKEHEEWLEEQIRNLGGDAHGQTALSSLITMESKGIEQVILGGDPEMSHIFHALLAAELVDNAGWDLLVALADEADDGEAQKAFKKRLREEEDHLVFVRKAVERFFRKELLHEEVSMPVWP